ncbi:MAG: AmmeMemoRadiSam system protein A [Gemmatimonadota bacterium]|nr:MAG: AmmeMemoRadiSam system protein A [Gemmatimonadota bacterium]
MNDIPTSEPGGATDVQLTARDKQALLQLARHTLEEYLETGSKPDVEIDSTALQEPRATFVTLTVRADGQLRGCRGEVVARQPLFESVMNNAIASAIDDPRFRPVTADEVPALHIEISVLTPMQPIEPEQVEVGRHGLMISKGANSGLLLPQVPIEWRWSREEFLDSVCRKAGLPPGTWRDRDAELFGFECEVWGEEE